MTEYFTLNERSNALLSNLIETQSITETHYYPCGPIKSLYDIIFAHSKKVPTVPAMAEALHLKAARENLPVYKFKHEILSAISQNQVIIVSGETGKK